MAKDDRYEHTHRWQMYRAAKGNDSAPSDDFGFSRGAIGGFVPAEGQDGAWQPFDSCPNHGNVLWRRLLVKQ